MQRQPNLGTRTELNDQAELGAADEPAVGTEAELAGEPIDDVDAGAAVEDEVSVAPPLQALSSTTAPCTDP